MLSEASFVEAVAAGRTGELLTCMQNGMDACNLTFAAEALAKAPSEPAVLGVLLELLQHSSPFVREGATLGLAGHNTLASRRALELAAQYDSSPGVRDAATDALAGLAS